jgi:hypothetical protein
MRVMAAIYNRLGLYIDWHHCQIDSDQLGLCIDGCMSSNQLQSAWIMYQWMYVIELIAISSDCVLIDVDSGFDDRFDGGFDGQFNLAVLSYRPQQSVRQLRQEAKRTRHFTNLFYWPR